MQRNTYATGDLNKPKSLIYVMDCAHTWL